MCYSHLLGPGLHPKTPPFFSVFCLSPPTSYSKDMWCVPPGDILPSCSSLFCHVDDKFNTYIGEVSDFNLVWKPRQHEDHLKHWTEQGSIVQNGMYFRHPCTDQLILCLLFLSLFRCIQTHLDYNESWFTFSQFLSVILNKCMEHEHIDMIS